MSLASGIKTSGRSTGHKSNSGCSNQWLKPSNYCYSSKSFFAKPFLWSLCPHTDIFSGTGDRASCPPSTKQTVVQSPAFPVYMRKCSWARFRTPNWTSFYCPKTFMLGNLGILNWPWMWGRWIALSVCMNSVSHNNRHIIYGPSWCSPTPTRRKKPTY